MLCYLQVWLATEYVDYLFFWFQLGTFIRYCEASNREVPKVHGYDLLGSTNQIRSVQPSLCLISMPLPPLEVRYLRIDISNYTLGF